MLPVHLCCRDYWLLGPPGEDSLGGAAGLGCADGLAPSVALLMVWAVAMMLDLRRTRLRCWRYLRSCRRRRSRSRRCLFHRILGDGRHRKRSDEPATIRIDIRFTPFPPISDRGPPAALIERTAQGRRKKQNESFSERSDPECGPANRFPLLRSSREYRADTSVATIVAIVLTLAEQLPRAGLGELNIVRGFRAHCAHLRDVESGHLKWTVSLGISGGLC